MTASPLLHLRRLNPLRGSSPRIPPPFVPIRRPTGVSRRFASSPPETHTSATPPPLLRRNPLLVDTTRAPTGHDPRSAVVYEGAVSEEEGRAVAADVEARMRRRRYERGHWDAVIDLYKEVELPVPSDGAPAPSAARLSDATVAAIERVRSRLESEHIGPAGARSHERDDGGGAGRVGADDAGRWLPCHGIDLKEDGRLGAHVDSVRYSGSVVAGLSLLSGSIMRLRPAPPSEIADSEEGEGEEEVGGGEGRSRVVAAPSEDGGDGAERGHVDLYLPPLSLYVLSGMSRFRYTHELLPSGSVFRYSDGRELDVKRGRRISVIFRDRL